MIEITIPSTVKTKEEAFSIFSDVLRPGQSVFSGWDAFIDVIGSYLIATENVISVNISVHALSDFERTILIDAMTQLSEDLPGQISICTVAT